MGNFAGCCAPKAEAYAEANGILPSLDEGICQQSDSLPPLFSVIAEENHVVEPIQKAEESDVVEPVANIVIPQSNLDKAGLVELHQIEPPMVATSIAPEGATAMPSTPIIDSNMHSSKPPEDVAQSAADSKNAGNQHQRPAGHAKAKPSSKPKKASSKRPAAPTEIHPNDNIGAPGKDVAVSMVDEKAGVPKGGSTLSVFIMSAKGLRDADIGSKSDPYCTVEYEEESQLMKVRTSVISNSQDPHWNEGFEFAYTRGCDLQFSVWDADDVKEDLLGTARLQHHHFNDKEGFNGDLLLGERGNATLHVKAIVTAASAKAVPHASICTPRLPPTALTIRNLSAKGLRNVDWLSKSDPYCTCQLSGMPGTKVMTEVVPDTLEPVWNATLHMQRAPGKDLVFEVWDKDCRKDDALGKTTLKEDAFYPTGFKGSLPLSEAGKGVTASIYVEVQVNDKFSSAS